MFGTKSYPTPDSESHQVTTAIALVYVPKLVLPLLCAHLALIYSLLLAAIISILRTQLTLNDGVFVLVTVASPASIYLWILTLVSMWKPDWFPVRIPHKPTYREVLKFFSITSLAFEIAMICVMFIPSKQLIFSQAACSKTIGRRLWVELIWEFTYVVQMLWILSVAFLFKLIFEFIHSYRRQPRWRRFEPDM